MRKGFIVFAPLFTFRSQADGENTDLPVNARHMLDMRAKWAGTSLAAIEVYKVVKALDHLVTKREIDADRIAVAGLSYGGFYALLVSALEKRIRLCISSCYFNDRILVNKTHPTLFFDWTWKGSVRRFSVFIILNLTGPMNSIWCFLTDPESIKPRRTILTIAIPSINR